MNDFNWNTTMNTIFYIKMYIISLLSKLTQPDNLYVDSLGDYWISKNSYECDGLVDTSYLFFYQRIKQSDYGIWYDEHEYLSKNTELLYYDNTKNVSN